MIKNSEINILIVEDTFASQKLLQDLLEINKYNVIVSSNGLEAISLLSKNNVDVVLLDLMMPKMNGIEVLEIVSKNDNLKDIPFIVISALSDEKDVQTALDKGAIDYIKKPINATELLARLRTAVRLKKAQDELKTQNKELLKQNTKLKNSEHIIFSLVNAIEAKNPYLEGHSKNVAFIASKIAEKLGLTEREKKVLKQGAILHDIGKIGTPDDILNKKGKLTDEEYKVIQKHCELGEIILKPLEGLQEVIKIVLHHHEKLDGTGFLKV